MKYLISACGKGVVLGSASFRSEAKDEHGVCELRPALSGDCGIVCVYDNKNWELWTQPSRVWVHLTVHILSAISYLPVYNTDFLY